jgi:hypothetical protein
MESRKKKKNQVTLSMSLIVSLIVVSPSPLKKELLETKCIGRDDSIASLHHINKIKKQKNDSLIKTNTEHKNKRKRDEKANGATAQTKKQTKKNRHQTHSHLTVT